MKLLDMIAIVPRLENKACLIIRFNILSDPYEKGNQQHLEI